MQVKILYTTALWLLMQPKNLFTAPSNIPYVKSNLGFAYTSQGIPKKFSNANSSTIQFTNAGQGLIYTNPAEWLIDSKHSPLANLVSTGSAINITHPK